MFSQSGDNTLLDWSTTRPTNRNAHLVMTTKTIQFVHVIGSETWPAAHFTRITIQLNTARSTIEMVRMVDFATEFQWLIVNNATMTKNIDVDS